MSTTNNRTYYDAFAKGYDRGRDRGYHRLIDDQAAELVRRVGEDAEILEVGCGTGLIMERVQRFARSVRGIDLSAGMLARARERGLDVCEGSADALPFADACFDVVYSFKVLAHVPNIERALAEMFRVVRPGGHVVFDTYNRQSLRYLIKRWWGPRATSSTFDEAAISTRFETPEEIRARLPPGVKVVDESGIRITTVHPAVHRVPVLGPIADRIEWQLMDSALWRYAGFVVLTVQKQ